MSNRGRGARVLVTTAVTSFAAVLALGGLFATSEASPGGTPQPDPGPGSIEVWVDSTFGIPGSGGEAKWLCVRQPKPPWRIPNGDKDTWVDRKDGTLCAPAGSAANPTAIVLERAK